MARPMLLIKPTTLEKLWSECAEGVPVSLLLRKHNIPMTPPTLTKLLSYVEALKDAKTKKVKEIIEASLYPSWLLDTEDKEVVLQPAEYRYEGTMSLGTWVQNEWSKSNVISLQTKSKTKALV